jgi:glycosyltransferase involved in cell wall biosynthesis
VACGRRAAAVSLVSSVEADRFERVVGRAVACLPMAVDGPAAAASVAENPPTMLFTGGLDYEPNLQALRWYRDEVAPHLEATGVRLDVIGHCPERARAEVESDAIRCVGYVEDLWGSLAAGRAFLAPIVSGTGVKTKVLEAMAAGLPVVATPAAVEGIAVEHGRSCFVARTGREFADLVRLVAAEPEAAARVGRAGRDVVRATYTSAVLRRRWEAVLSGVAIEERPRA